jgi:hypothetical protein
VRGAMGELWVARVASDLVAGESCRRSAGQVASRSGWASVGSGRLVNASGPRGEGQLGQPERGKKRLGRGESRKRRKAAGLL